MLFNKQTLTAYIGKLNNIEKRFFEHYRALMDGSHFNLGLLKWGV